MTTFRESIEQLRDLLRRGGPPWNDEYRRAVADNLDAILSQHPVGDEPVALFRWRLPGGPWRLTDWEGVPDDIDETDALARWDHVPVGPDPYADTPPEQPTSERCGGTGALPQGGHECITRYACPGCDDCTPPDTGQEKRVTDDALGREPCNCPSVCTGRWDQGHYCQQFPKKPLPTADEPRTENKRLREALKRTLSAFEELVGVAHGMDGQLAQEFSISTDPGFGEPDPRIVKAESAIADGRRVLSNPKEDS